MMFLSRAESSYLHQHLSVVRHVTLDPEGPGVLRIHFTLSAIGVKVGAVFGDKYRAVSERIGGLVLILIGLKTLIQSFL